MRVKLEDCFSSLQTRHGRPCTRWEVARSWRLGRQVSYVIVSAQLKLRPARQLKHWAADRGKIKSSQALMFLALASSSPN
jgi:hypothetical protein